MSQPSLAEHRFGVASASLGMHPIHNLETKIKAIGDSGFEWAGIGAENFFEWVRIRDQGLPSSTCPAEWGEGDEPDPSDDSIWDAIFRACEDLKTLTAQHGVTPLVFQPLNQYDGWPHGHPREAFARRKAQCWLRMCSKMGVELLQVGSNNMPDALDISHLDKYADDMRYLAEMGSAQDPPVKIAYECWCFAVHVNTWELTWEIVKRADHPNLGLCLDLAHFPLAPEYGFDPTTGAGFEKEAFSAMANRISRVPSDKIFYVEMSDVVLPQPPLYHGSFFDEWAKRNAPVARGDRFIWTVCGRPVPLVGRNAGEIPMAIGGARVVEALLAILSTGFDGPIVFEFFEAEFMSIEDDQVPFRYAAACRKSRGNLIEACGHLP